jgi:predicted nuclease of predicted toxin-antitoxin system
MKFLADEDFDNRILRGILRRLPGLDIVRVQDTEVATFADPDVLEWAAVENRVLLTHDVHTMTHYFRIRLSSGLSSPGIIFVRQVLPMSTAINELILIAQYSLEEEYKNQMRFIPFD